MHQLVATFSRRVPWKHDFFIATLVLTALVCAFNYEIVFLGRTLVATGTAGVMGQAGSYPIEQLRPDLFRLDPGASEWQFVPWAKIDGKEYASGKVPLWNPYQGFGVPLLANAQSGALAIWRLPVYLTDTALAWDMYYLVRWVAGALAAYAYARAIGLVASARYFLAVSYVFSGHFVLFSNNVWIEAYFLLPVLLTGTELIASGRTRRGLMVTALTTTCAILVGMPEVTLFVMVGGCSYAAYRLVAPDKRLLPLRSRLVSLSISTSAFVLGVALAAPLLLPLAAYFARSSLSRAGRAAVGMTHASASDAANWVVPYLKGYPLQDPSHWIVGTYIGATVAILAVFGALPGRSPIHRRVAPFALTLSLVLLAKSYGLPVVSEVGRLPLLESIWVEKWSAPVTGFLLSLLASIGVHRIVTERLGWKMTVVVLTAFLGLAVVLERGLSTDSTEHAGFEWLSLALACWVVVVTISRLPRRLPSQVIGYSLVAVAWFELFTLAPHGAYQDRRDPLTPAPFVEFLRTQPADGRFRIFATDGLLYPNLAGAFGLEDVRSLDAIYPDRYVLYVQNFLAGNFRHRYIGSPIGSNEDETRLVNNSWFDLAGIRYVITKTESTRAPKASTPVFATSDFRKPTSQGDPTQEHQYVKVYHSDAQVFVNQRALPRVVIVREVRPVPNRDAALEVMQGKGIQSRSLHQNVSGADRQWIADFEKVHGR